MMNICTNYQLLVASIQKSICIGWMKLIQIKTPTYVSVCVFLFVRVSTKCQVN